MTPTTRTPQVGTPPLAAGRVGSVRVAGSFPSRSASRRAAAPRPYAGFLAAGLGRHHNRVLESGWWGTGAMAATHTIERLARHLAPRVT